MGKRKSELQKFKLWFEEKNHQFKSVDKKGIMKYAKRGKKVESLSVR